MLILRKHHVDCWLKKTNVSFLTVDFLLPPPLALVCPHCPKHVPFGCAQDGRLAAGDQLLSVDGRSLVGLSQERYRRLSTCLLKAEY